MVTEATERGEVLSQTARRILTDYFLSKGVSLAPAPAEDGGPAKARRA